MNKKILFLLLLFCASQHSQLIFGMNNDTKDNKDQKETKEEEKTFTQKDIDTLTQNYKTQLNKIQEKQSFLALATYYPNIFFTSTLQGVGTGFGQGFGAEIAKKVLGADEIANLAQTGTIISNTVRTGIEFNDAFGRTLKLKYETKGSEKNTAMIEKLEKAHDENLENLMEMQKTNKEVHDKAKRKLQKL